MSKGWLVGPLQTEALPEGASVTRRFGVKQVASNQNGERTVKVRPIDDFSESLIKSAVSSEEKISIHSVDVIVAGILDRMRRPTLDSKCGLQAKAIDLRKAYKQLPLSEESLRDAYICVTNPDTMLPEVFASFPLVQRRQYKLFAVRLMPCGLWEWCFSFFIGQYTSMIFFWWNPQSNRDTPQ